MASFDLPEIPQPRVSPALLVGVASPLWSYFGAAAAGGVAYWWMTQWARPVNVEALVGARRALPTPEVVLAPVVEPMMEAAEAVADAGADILETAGETLMDAAPAAVGGEAAPISPPVEAAPVIEPEPEPAPLLDAAPEPVIEEPAPVAGEFAPKPRGKKPAVALDPEA